MSDIRFDTTPVEATSIGGAAFGIGDVDHDAVRRVVDAMRSEGFHVTSIQVLHLEGQRVTVTFVANACPAPKERPRG